LLCIRFSGAKNVELQAMVVFITGFVLYVIWIFAHMYVMFQKKININKSLESTDSECSIESDNEMKIIHSKTETND